MFQSKLIWVTALASFISFVLCLQNLLIFWSCTESTLLLEQRSYPALKNSRAGLRQLITKMVLETSVSKWPSRRITLTLNQSASFLSRRLKMHKVAVRPTRQRWSKHAENNKSMTAGSSDKRRISTVQPCIWLHMVCITKKFDTVAMPLFHRFLPIFDFSYVMNLTLPVARIPRNKESCSIFKHLVTLKGLHELSFHSVPKHYCLGFWFL
ncbi:uncharacterized protein EV154DRAFT_480954 [Mucor mucedo]|uniref:uncharacterized protein n=1 Tax=Mucor mucedo TaxID=29922 RepID=UPI00221FE7DB|nr:uncharacterized protein EV154DRAFT_480954 [Mucor mucedo]KAI7891751.1 hypothetical protein EV154DRAFT_480954 [Mucor mucedo]